MLPTPISGWDGVDGERVDRARRFWNGFAVDSVSKVPRLLRQLIPVLGVCVMVLLVGLVRCWNAGDVFFAGQTFFVDADCYSRMTRVERVMMSGEAVRHQEFENWPEGVESHATAPLDFLTAALAWGLYGLGGGLQQALDGAGAAISLLLGMAMAAFLWGWAGWMRLRYRGPLLLLFAFSPMLVHGTLLGRPDHQSLILLCMAVALGAEAALLKQPTRGWGMAAGGAWGLGLWVSLYEPGILLLLALGLSAALNPRGLFARVRWAGWGVFFGVIGVGLLVDGWHSPVPDPEVVKYFPNWSRSIGEMASIPLFSSTLLRWTLAILPLAPVLLWWRGRTGTDERRVCWFWLGLLVALVALTCWQVRWGYFLSLVFVMALPLMLEALPKRWMALTLFTLALWPVARDWEDRLGWSEQGRVQVAQRFEQRRENLALYHVAQLLKGPEGSPAGEVLPFMAPWWQSPALAYWSGQPGVAGSSHQSLPGTVDASRVYLASATDDKVALEILAKRGVRRLVVYDPERVEAVSATILGLSEIPKDPLVRRLFARPHSPPPGFRLIEGPQNQQPYFRVFGVLF